MCELTEIGYPVCMGRNPLLNPVSSRDFASYIVHYILEDDDEAVSNTENTEVLVGGPQLMTWSELGYLLASKRFLPFLVLACLFFVTKP